MRVSVCVSLRSEDGDWKAGEGAYSRSGQRGGGGGGREEQGGGVAKSSTAKGNDMQQRVTTCSKARSKGEAALGQRARHN